MWILDDHLLSLCQFFPNWNQDTWFGHHFENALQPLALLQRRSNFERLFNTITCIWSRCSTSLASIPWTSFDVRDAKLELVPNQSTDIPSVSNWFKLLVYHVQVLLCKVFVFYPWIYALVENKHMMWYSSPNFPTKILDKRHEPL